ncbi:MAG: hypothetical protein OQK82_07710 [Candidatus Pacearchaeota archaeon]|nr:hypothetical protein [Candidatus Pacearchaeota archaeon]
MRNLMFGDTEEIKENLLSLPDITTEELITAVIGLCSKVSVLEDEIKGLKKEIEGLKNGN